VSQCRAPFQLGSGIREWLYCPGRLRPELFPGIGVLPEPASATESHIVNRGTQ